MGSWNTIIIISTSQIKKKWAIEMKHCAHEHSSSGTHVRCEFSVAPDQCFSMFILPPRISIHVSGNKKPAAVVQFNLQLFWVKIQKIQKRISCTAQYASILWRCLFYQFLLGKISNLVKQLRTCLAFCNRDCISG